jgi:hypothetical protein
MLNLNKRLNLTKRWCLMLNKTCHVTYTPIHFFNKTLSYSTIEAAVNDVHVSFSKIISHGLCPPNNSVAIWICSTGAPKFHDKMLIKAPSRFLMQLDHEMKASLVHPWACRPPFQIQSTSENRTVWISNGYLSDTICVRFSNAFEI